MMYYCNYSEINFMKYFLPQCFIVHSLFLFWIYMKCDL